jgi:signal transduction histidine kinase
LLITISDDGNGFDEQLARKGNGLMNMKTRAEYLHAALSIETAKGKGTSIKLLLPASP